MPSTVGQQPLFVVLFSAIGTCLAVILIYMAISYYFQRQRAIKRHELDEAGKRESHPMAWETRPAKLRTAVRHNHPPKNETWPTTTIVALARTTHRIFSLSYLVCHQKQDLLDPGERGNWDERPRVDSTRKQWPDASIYKVETPCLAGGLMGNFYLSLSEVMLYGP